MVINEEFNLKFSREDTTELLFWVGLIYLGIYLFF
jgi:hypothetical protein